MQVNCHHRFSDKENLNFADQKLSLNFTVRKS